MPKRITYDVISQKTGLSLSQIGRYSKSTTLKGEKLLNYLLNDVIGVDKSKPKIIKSEKIPILKLTGDEPDLLRGQIIAYNQIVQIINDGQLNNATLNKYLTLLFKAAKAIDDQKAKLGFSDMESAIED